MKLRSSKTFGPIILLAAAALAIVVYISARPADPPLESLSPGTAARQAVLDADKAVEAANIALTSARKVDQPAIQPKAAAK